MTQQLWIGGESIPYTIEHSRRSRRLRLTMRPGGHLTVTVPAGVSFDRVKPLIESHQTWILKQHARQINVQVQHLPSMTDVAAYRAQRSLAKSLVWRLLEDIQQTESLPQHTVTIKNHRTRWGSCSKQGNLNFNYRIVFLPLDLARYIVVHEICHLYELNHSRAFWNHVARLVPNHREQRARLRGYTWRAV